MLPCRPGAPHHFSSLARRAQGHGVRWISVPADLIGCAIALRSYQTLRFFPLQEAVWRALVRHPESITRLARTFRSTRTRRRREQYMPLVAFCLRHFSADFIICTCEFEFRQAQEQSCEVRSRDLRRLMSDKLG